MNLVELAKIYTGKNDCSANECDDCPLNAHITATSPEVELPPRYTICDLFDCINLNKPPGKWEPGMVRLKKDREGDDKVQLKDRCCVNCKGSRVVKVVSEPPVDDKYYGFSVCETLDSDHYGHLTTITHTCESWTFHGEVN